MKNLPFSVFNRADRPCYSVSFKNEATGEVRVSRLAAFFTLHTLWKTRKITFESANRVSNGCHACGSGKRFAGNKYMEDEKMDEAAINAMTEDELWQFNQTIRNGQGMNVDLMMDKLDELGKYQNLNSIFIVP